MRLVLPLLVLSLWNHTNERNDESHAAFAADDDEMNSNLALIQAGALLHRCYPYLE